MNQKIIAISLIIISLLLAFTIFMIKFNEDMLVEKVVEQEGSCFLEDGTCLHNDREITFYIISWIISGILMIAGISLLMMDTLQGSVMEHSRKVSEALENAKKQERIKDEFKAFISGFSEEEQNILKAVREQEGIKQSTLRYRTGLSKTSLSLILKSLEKREIISRKKSGKTNEVFLRNKF